MDRNNEFTLEIEVRFRDLDALGHMNNAVYFTYFEEGRKSFSQAHFGVNNPGDFGFILARIACDFIAPVKLGDRVLLRMTVGDIGNKSFTFRYAMVDSRDPARVFAQGKSTQVCYDYRKNTTRPVSEPVREILDRFRSST